MLLSKYVYVIMNGKNCSYYKKLGYKFHRMDKVKVKIDDLQKESNQLVLVKCEKCGKERYIQYFQHNRHSDGKDYCDQCKAERSKKTNIKKYGCENVFQNKEIRDRQNKTVEEKYGCENVFSCDFIKDKIKQTNKEKYGVENPMQNDEIKEKSQKNQRESMMKNGTQQCSKQQEYIANVLGYEINYLFDNLWLDGFYEKKNIYFEYNGSGHDIAVKYHKISPEQFKEKEIKRYKFLKTKGLKEIIFVSKKDIVLLSNILIEMEAFCDSLFQKGFNFVEINFDNNTIRTSKWETSYDDLDNKFSPQKHIVTTECD